MSLVTSLRGNIRSFGIITIAWMAAFSWLPSAEAYPIYIDRNPDPRGFCKVNLPTMLGIASLAFVLMFLALRRANASEKAKWLQSFQTATETNRRMRPIPTLPTSKLAELMLRVDHDFSIVQFGAFLKALYASAQTLRGPNQLGQLSAYLVSQPLWVLDGLGDPEVVKDVFVSGLRFLDDVRLEPTSTRFQITVEFEANYVEVRGTRSQGYSVTERWSLEREPKVRALSLERLQSLGCPACNAPFGTVTGGICGSCAARVNTGQFAWVVHGIEIEKRERIALSSGDGAVNPGTD